MVIGKISLDTSFVVAMLRSGKLDYSIKSSIVNQKLKILTGASMPKASSKKTEKPVEELSYEEALAELEGIVSTLEGEQGQLDEAIKLFERGQALAARCSALLEAAQLKVKQVTGEDLIPFEEESE
jgi:exodeoxyribonuclease VII small subunit